MAQISRERVVWFHSFFFSRLGAQPKPWGSSLPYYLAHSWSEDTWIHMFLCESDTIAPKRIWTWHAKSTINYCNHYTTALYKLHPHKTMVTIWMLSVLWIYFSWFLKLWILKKYKSLIIKIRILNFLFTFK